MTHRISLWYLCRLAIILAAFHCNSSISFDFFSAPINLLLHEKFSRPACCHRCEVEQCISFQVISFQLNLKKKWNYQRTYAAIPGIFHWLDGGQFVKTICSSGSLIKSAHFFSFFFFLPITPFSENPTNDFIFCFKEVCMTVPRTSNFYKSTTKQW